MLSSGQMVSLTNRKPSAERGEDSAATQPPSPKTERRNAAAVLGESPSKLLSYDEILPWRQDNPHIRHGYRPLSKSAAKCITSWSYLHNETMNIYSHLLPAIFLIIVGSVAYRDFVERYPLAAPSDLAVFAFWLLSALVCFVLSTGYHTLENHSEKVCIYALRCDYVGILTLTLGDFVSGIRMGFFCEPKLRIIYWTMVRSHI